MCLIVDTNCISSLLRPSDPAVGAIFEWLKRDGRIVYGGKLWSEIACNQKARELFIQLARAGKATRVSDDAVSKAEVALAGRLRSNDRHVIALAIASRARVLFSDDAKLCEDFRDHKLIGNPRGKIYRKKLHARRLLQHHRSCRSHVP